MDQEQQAVYDDLIAKRSPEFYCDNCEYYPIVPVHGHFECPNCNYKSKCCEGVALDE